MTRPALGCMTCVGADVGYWTFDSKGAKWIIYPQPSPGELPGAWTAFSNAYVADGTIMTNPREDLLVRMVAVYSQTIDPLKVATKPLDTSGYEFKQIPGGKALDGSAGVNPTQLPGIPGTLGLPTSVPGLGSGYTLPPLPGVPAPPQIGPSYTPPPVAPVAKEPAKDNTALYVAGGVGLALLGAMMFTKKGS